MNMKKSQGFTLIELMIVVAIVAILAAIALPAYQDYLRRSKVSEVVATAGACKTSVAEFAASRNRLPADIEEAGCSIDETQYVATVDVVAGVITVEIQNIYTDLDSSNVIFTPTSNSDMDAPVVALDEETIAGWHCATDADATLYKLFPASCRNTAP